MYLGGFVCTEFPGFIVIAVVVERSEKTTASKLVNVKVQVRVGQPRAHAFGVDEAGE